MTETDDRRPAAARLASLNDATTAWHERSIGIAQTMRITAIRDVFELYVASLNSATLAAPLGDSDPIKAADGPWDLEEET